MHWTKQETINILISRLTEKFPIDYTEKHFTLYPVSNEHFFSKALTTLKNSKKELRTSRYTNA